MNIQEITQLLVDEGCVGVIVTSNNGIFRATMPDGYYIPFKSRKMPIMRDIVLQVARRILTK